MATSIQARPMKDKPADSVSNTANSTQIKTLVKPTLRSDSSDAIKVSSSDQNKSVPNHLKPTRRSPPHESFRYVKKDGQNGRNFKSQNHKAVLSSALSGEGTTRTARRTSQSPGAKKATSCSAKPGQERVSKASKPGKIHQLYVKKTTPPSNGKETQDPAASTEMSKDDAVDPVSRADNQETKQEETLKDTKKVEPVEEEVTIPNETVEKVQVDVSVREGDEEERKKLQISEVCTVSEEEENGSHREAEPRERLAGKEEEVEGDGKSGMRNGKGKKEGEELEERKEGEKKEKMRVESEVEEVEKKKGERNRKEEGEGEGEKRGKIGTSGGGEGEEKGKKESAPAYKEAIEETAASKVLGGEEEGSGWGI